MAASIVVNNAQASMAASMVVNIAQARMAANARRALHQAAGADESFPLAAAPEPDGRYCPTELSLYLDAEVTKRESGRCPRCLLFSRPSRMSGEVVAGTFRIS
eukprot:6179107-Pleurochrysis_carterae.AAC.1